MKLSTTAFEPDGMIPARYTCDGDDISPELSWQDLPGGTTSLAIICDDPDAPAGTWVHWVYYDIPFQVNRLPAGVSHQERPASGGVQGVNDFGKLGYGGPCPPRRNPPLLFQSLRPGQCSGAGAGGSPKSSC